MPPIVFSSIAKVALGMLGAGAVVHWMTKEIRRINDELERVRTGASADAGMRRTFPTLRRDPQSGEWRVL
jgi:hypothetical protein